MSGKTNPTGTPAGRPSFNTSFTSAPKDPKTETKKFSFGASNANNAPAASTEKKTTTSFGKVAAPSPEAPKRTHSTAVNSFGSSKSFEPRPTSLTTQTQGKGTIPYSAPQQDERNPSLSTSAANPFTTSTTNNPFASLVASQSGANPFTTSTPTAPPRATTTTSPFDAATRAQQGRAALSISSVSPFTTPVASSTTRVLPALDASELPPPPVSTQPARSTKEEGSKLSFSSFRRPESQFFQELPPVIDDYDSIQTESPRPAPKSSFGKSATSQPTAPRSFSFNSSSATAPAPAPKLSSQPKKEEVGFGSWDTKEPTKKEKPVKTVSFFDVDSDEKDDFMWTTQRPPKVQPREQSITSRPAPQPQTTKTQAVATQPAFQPPTIETSTIDPAKISGWSTQLAVLEVKLDEKNRCLEKKIEDRDTQSQAQPAPQQVQAQPQVVHPSQTTTSHNTKGWIQGAAPAPIPNPFMNASNNPFVTNSAPQVGMGQVGNSQFVPNTVLDSSTLPALTQSFIQGTGKYTPPPSSLPPAYPSLDKIEQAVDGLDAAMKHMDQQANDSVRDNKNLDLALDQSMMIVGQHRLTQSMMVGFVPPAPPAPLANTFFWSDLDVKYSQDEVNTLVQNVQSAQGKALLGALGEATSFVKDCNDLLDKMQTRKSYLNSIFNCQDPTFDQGQFNNLDRKLRASAVSTLFSYLENHDVDQATLAKTAEFIAMDNIHNPSLETITHADFLEALSLRRDMLKSSKEWLDFWVATIGNTITERLEPMATSGDPADLSQSWMPSQQQQ